MGRKVERDADGVEFAVEVGFGRIEEIKWPPEGKQNAEVFIDAENLKIPVRGWADTLNDTIRTVLEEDPKRIRYRIEIVRKETVDKAIPFDDVPNLERFRRLVELVAVDQERRTANRPPDAPPAPPTGGDITDTWGYAAALGSIELALDLAIEARDRGEIEQISPALCTRLGGILLTVADNAQVKIRGKLDRNANSHTRARGAVRSAVRCLPIPFDDFALGVDEPVDEWAARIQRIAIALMGGAVELMNGAAAPKPAAAEADPPPSQPSAVDGSPDQPQADRSGTEPSGFEAPPTPTDEAPGGDDSPGAGSPLEQINALKLTGKELGSFRDLVKRNGLPWPLRGTLSAEQMAIFAGLLAEWNAEAA